MSDFCQQSLPTNTCRSNRCVLCALYLERMPVSITEMREPGGLEPETPT